MAFPPVQYMYVYVVYSTINWCCLPDSILVVFVFLVCIILREQNIFVVNDKIAFGAIFDHHFSL